MEDVICNRCDSVNDYSTTTAGVHLKATCNRCGRYIKFLSKAKDSVTPKAVLHFGKYKGKEISSLTSTDELSYLQWLLRNVSLTNKDKDNIIIHLNKHNYGN